MALIKCEECGKEISDRAARCPQCGCPVEIEKNPKKEPIKKETNTENQTTTEKKTNSKWIPIAIFAGICVLLLFMIIIINKTSNDSENQNTSKDVVVDFYYGEGCTHCDDFLKYYRSLDDKIKSKVTFNKYEVWSNERNAKKMEDVIKKLNIETPGFPLVVINQKDYFIGYDNETAKNFYNKLIEYLNNEDETESFEDTRTPREKLIDHYKNVGKNMSCTSNQCTEIFTVANTSTYYKLDFDAKKYSTETHIYGTNYNEYDFGNETGYSKVVSTVGWTTTTEVTVVFNPSENTYTWNCNSDLPTYCETTGADIAKQIDNLRTQLLEDCAEAGISCKDL